MIQKAPDMYKVYSKEYQTDFVTRPQKTEHRGPYPLICSIG
jgi:hypothetical protein